MVVDYEQAWQRLGELIASKPQHGREPTLVAMQEIAADSRVAEGELARLFRLYGVEVDQARRITDRDEADGFDVGAPSTPDSDLPGHHDPGGHDGTGPTSSRQAAAVG